MFLKGVPPCTMQTGLNSISGYSLTSVSDCHIHFQILDENKIPPPIFSLVDCLFKIANLGVPVVAQQKRIPLGTMRLRVQSLASLSGLKIRHCRELQCRLQTQLRSGVAVALA